MTNFLQKYCPVIAALVFILQGTVFAQDKNASPKPSFPPLITVPEKSPAAVPGDMKAGASADKIVDNFFTSLGKDQIDQAYDQLTRGTKIAEKTEDVATLKSKTKEAVKLFGEVQGYELVSIKNVGTHLMRSTYLWLGKGFPLRWRFYFYKSDKTWRLIHLRVDDRLVDMFDERNPNSQSKSADDDQ